jgi:hypothetical protein
VTVVEQISHPLWSWLIRLEWERERWLLCLELFVQPCCRNLPIFWRVKRPKYSPQMKPTLLKQKHHRFRTRKTFCFCSRLLDLCISFVSFGSIGPEDCCVGGRNSRVGSRTGFAWDVTFAKRAVILAYSFSNLVPNRSVAHHFRIAA